MISNFQELDMTKIVLITGASGFIGYHLSKALLEKGNTIIGFDNMNDYYQESLKTSRLAILKEFPNFTFMKGDIYIKNEIDNVFLKYHPNIVVNLAAQAGVRYSIENPEAYIQSNIVGFFNILECCRVYGVEHLMYASSSSVYGGNNKIPFSEEDKVDRPVSLYAATKKTDELMAYSYSHLYKIPTTGLRFFTVYGPYGRPDMAYYLFTKAIFNNQPIKIFNNGDMYRDFTYIDDIVSGIEKMLCNPPREDELGSKYKIYNIGNNNPVKLMDFIKAIEKNVGKEGIKENYPMQKGDVYRTFADITELVNDFDFKPSTQIDEGIAKFVEWYRQFYNK